MAIEGTACTSVLAARDKLVHVFCDWELLSFLSVNTEIDDFSYTSGIIRISICFFLVSDLSEHLESVPQRAVWVQVHADWPQLVQLLLWSTDTQGESVYRQNTTVITVTSNTVIIKTIIIHRWQCDVRVVQMIIDHWIVPLGVAVGLWSHKRIWSEFHRCLHRGKIFSFIVKSEWLILLAAVLLTVNYYHCKNKSYRLFAMHKILK